ncbi:hypothetical protein HDU85_000338 [Gaertneriomyces sp. JEL0708]|nr:hypothetical protein HDU85_000338 [Gaertneriomyces sp. JEL0708]
MSSTASARGGVGPSKGAIAEQHPHGVTRHKIVISRPDASNKSYHIMRVMNSKFDLKSFIPPVRLTRELPKPREKFGRNNQEAATNGNGGGNGSGVAGGSGTGTAGAQATTTSSTSNIQGKEKLDPTQIAPFGNAVRNRQNLFKKKTRTAIYGRLEDDDGKEPRRGRKDPDKFPWLLSDFDGSQQYVGNVEYMPNVRYMMMIRKGDEYKMMPVQKLYKFQPKPKYRTLTTEEADELLKQSARKRLDTWIMHQKREQEEVQSATDVDKKPTKAWAQKILEDGKANPARRSNQRANDGGEELDFEEEFADDEDVQFGIEDEEEQKEAVKRQYGSLAKRSGFLDDGDEDDELLDESARTAGRTIGKQLKKVLRKVNEDGNDVYHSDEDNPYASEESDEEDETENVKKEADTEEAVVAPAKRKGSDSARSSARGSPLISPEHMGAFGKRLKSSGSPAISPLHAAALGMPKKSARSPAHTSAGGSKATSPLSIGSPLGTPRDMKKRKATDEGTGGEKKSRTDTGPIVSKSASEILKVLAGGSAATSPTHAGSFGRSSSQRSLGGTGGKKKTSSANSPVGSMSPGNALGATSPASQGARSTPPGRVKAKSKPVAASNANPLKPDALVAVYRNKSTDTLPLKELVAILKSDHGINSLDAQTKSLLKDMCIFEGNGSGAVKLKPEHKNW